MHVGKYAIAGAVIGLITTGCGGGGTTSDGQAALQPLPSLDEGTSALAGRALVAPMRGVARIGLIGPNGRVETQGGQRFAVTEFQVMNLEDAPIAGLMVEDLWYDGNDQIVAGDEYRHPGPLGPGEQVAIELRVPLGGDTERNQYQFTHSNGDIMPEQMDEFPTSGDAEPAAAEGAN